MPIFDQVTEVWAPDRAHAETYQRVMVSGAALRPEVGSWVVTIELDGLASSSLEAVARSYQDRVAPELLAAPGLQSSFLAVDREHGKAIAVSYSRDQPSPRDRESTVARWQEFALAHGLRVLDVSHARLILADQALGGVSDGGLPSRLPEAEPTPSGDTRVEVEQLGDEAIVVVRIKGTLDRFSGPRIKNILVRALEAGTNELVIDPSGVVSVDSSGVGVLVGTLKRARRDGGGLRLAGENHKLWTMLRMMSLDQMFPHDGSVQEAINQFRTAPTP